MQGQLADEAMCMCQVAFLASMVSPKVAAAAAQKALEVLGEEDPCILAEADYLEEDNQQQQQQQEQHREEQQQRENGVKEAREGGVSSADAPAADTDRQPSGHGEPCHVVSKRY